jgi:hypothetical protein
MPFGWTSVLVGRSILYGIVLPYAALTNRIHSRSPLHCGCNFVHKRPPFSNNCQFGIYQNLSFRIGLSSQLPVLFKLLFAKPVPFCSQGLSMAIALKFLQAPAAEWWMNHGRVRSSTKPNDYLRQFELSGEGETLQRSGSFHTSPLAPSTPSSSAHHGQLRQT